MLLPLLFVTLAQGGRLNGGGRPKAQEHYHSNVSYLRPAVWNISFGRGERRRSCHVALLPRNAGRAHLRARKLLVCVFVGAVSGRLELSTVEVRVIEKRRLRFEAEEHSRQGAEPPPHPGRESLFAEQLYFPSMNRADPSAPRGSRLPSLGRASGGERRFHLRIQSMPPIFHMWAHPMGKLPTRCVQR